jgi:hypothetical protein
LLLVKNSVQALEGTIEKNSVRDEKSSLRDEKTSLRTHYHKMIETLEKYKAPPEQIQSYINKILALDAEAEVSCSKKTEEEDEDKDQDDEVEPLYRDSQTLLLDPVVVDSELSGCEDK